MTAPSPPDVLYKYLPPERIDILENLRVKFGAPADFTDTFDADYIVPISQGLKAITARTRFRNRLGIFCLTERPDDHLMWVHYARNHTGFVVGFDAKSTFFSEEGRTLDKVKYRTGPQVFKEVDMSVCLYNSKEWQYEREWRCVQQFDDPKESRLIEISPSLITQVIFGFKMEPWQVARIMLCATALDMVPLTQFFFYKPKRKSWTFQNQPSNISLCECQGSGYLIESS